MKLAFIFVLSLCFTPIFAQISETPDPLFLNESTLAVTITAPMNSLVRERDKEEYLQGTFQFSEVGKQPVELDLEIRTRGNFRHSNCDFPPLSLNFKKSQTDGTLFDKQNKMKLVVHCDDSKRYEQVVLREHLAYKILNAVTNMSFRVRLLRVTYVDSEGKRDDQTRYAFLIEHKNRLGERYDLEDLKIVRTSVGVIQPDRLNLTSIFGYMIGNTDFSPVAGAPGDDCCHNYVLFGETGAPIVAIPYDFDQSGLVDAPYARPNHRFRIRTVRQRLYRGRCVNNEHIAASLQRFNERRDSVYAAVEAQEGFEDRTRKIVTEYIDDFYELINDPRDVERRIIKNCI